MEDVGTLGVLLLPVAFYGLDGFLLMVSLVSFRLSCGFPLTSFWLPAGFFGVPWFPLVLMVFVGFIAASLFALGFLFPFPPQGHCKLVESEQKASLVGLVWF